MYYVISVFFFFLNNHPCCKCIIYYTYRYDLKSIVFQNIFIEYYIFNCFSRLLSLPAVNTIFPSKIYDCNNYSYRPILLNYFFDGHPHRITRPSQQNIICYRIIYIIMDNMPTGT